MSDSTAFESMSADWCTQQPNEAMKNRFSFPAKLYNILETSDKSIVDWLPHGKAFRVFDLDKFVNITMPSYFKQSKFGSFQRQLNIYGFKRILRGYGHGAYFNKNFQRGRLDLLVNIKRITSQERDDAMLQMEIEPSSSSYQDCSFGLMVPPLSSSSIESSELESPKLKNEPFSPTKNRSPFVNHNNNSNESVGGVSVKRKRTK